MTISATTRGLRPGVCTSTTRPGSPYDGQLIYETDTNRVAVYDTSSWVYKTPASTTGSVLQVVSTVKADTFSTASTSYTDVTGLTVTITPSSTSNKILVQADCKTGNSNGSRATVRLVRDTTAIYDGTAAGNRIQSFFGGDGAGTNSMYQASAVFLDSPSTTSATVYKIQMRVPTGTGYLNRTDADTDTGAFTRTSSSITVTEIAG